METGFHAVLPGRWVVHFHSLAAILMADLFFKADESFFAFVKEVFHFDFVFYRQLMPGYELSRKISEKPNSRLFVLENHGILFQSEVGESLEQVIRSLQNWEKIEKRFLAEFGYPDYHSKTFEEGPWRNYLPDCVVFKQRILKILAPHQEHYRLLQNDDLDASEIWRAMCWLNQANPDLGVLNEGIAQNVTQLPTEKFRQDLGSKK